MALAFISDTAGMATAKEIARHCEYVWQNDPNKDDFAPFYFDNKTER